MCRPEAQLCASHPVVAVSSPPHQHLPVPVDWYAVALLGVVVALRRWWSEDVRRKGWKSWDEA